MLFDIIILNSMDTLLGSKLIKIISANLNNKGYCNVTSLFIGSAI